jgi:hypothetical protein
MIMRAADSSSPSDVEANTVYHSAAPHPRLKSTTRECFLVIAGSLLAFIIAVGCMFLATLLIGAGMHPESLASIDGVAPIIGLFCGAVWCGLKTGGSGWRRGLAIGLLAVGCWVLAWGYVTSRIMFAMWWRQSIGTLTKMHLEEWAIAIGVSVVGGALGQRLRPMSRSVRRVTSVAAILLVPLAMLVGRYNHEPEVPLAAFPHSASAATPAKGVSIRCSAPDAEGTTVRLLTFDFAANPQLRLRLYDADSDDYTPYDNANTTFLGQSIDFVLSKLRARQNRSPDKVLAVFNGGFFGGSSRWIAAHEAPVVIDGQPHYNLNIMKEKWDDQAWVFGVVRNAGHTRFELKPDVAWQDLKRYDTAISGLRPLRINGQAQPLDPGSGAPGLRCSRTSIGWSADSRFFYLLIVRDPDGEAASIRQRKLKQPQTGGWDASQILSFWERLGVPNAALCDSGESTQLCYRLAPDRYVTIRSSYNLSRTIGYWRSRPIRLIIPALPGPLSQGGVLNYLYITG